MASAAENLHDLSTDQACAAMIKNLKMCPCFLFLGFLLSAAARVGGALSVSRGLKMMQAQPTTS
jgi:hypothetical protein